MVNVLLDAVRRGVAADMADFRKREEKALHLELADVKDALNVGSTRLESLEEDEVEEAERKAHEELQQRQQFLEQSIAALEAGHALFKGLAGKTVDLAGPDGALIGLPSHGKARASEFLKPRQTVSMLPCGWCSSRARLTSLSVCLSPLPAVHSEHCRGGQCDTIDVHHAFCG